MSKDKFKLWTDEEPTIGHTGMWDVRDRMWLGNDKGPLTYPDPEHAMIAAAIMSGRIGRTISPRPYEKEAKNLVDKITPDKSAEEAIEEIKKGR